MEHATIQGHQGEWILKVPYLAPKEALTLQLLNGPNIDTIRFSEGIVKIFPVEYQRVFPIWIKFILMSLLIFGFITLISFLYFLIKFLITL